ncbi:hypothetical protein ACCAA_190006 [Candidatus Accumulibacter aalborgensis]|uniref:Uncharacterized protein n=1 Tax=Candidatus Accumulibacter aalborgensis TaxID=1860102 RepID=A0A1A8XI48_9PROT|nr:hypothetical protein ACCAA_190006 [Candidatus Accumulibacter aalborgensis]
MGLCGRCNDLSTASVYPICPLFASQLPTDFYSRAAESVQHFDDPKGHLDGDWTPLRYLQ